jgi:leucyl aminopeptidase
MKPAVTIAERSIQSLLGLKLDQSNFPYDAHDLVIFVAPDGEKCTKSLQQLKNFCDPRRQESSHEIQICHGQWGPQQTFFYVVQCLKTPANGFERRWMFHQWFKKLPFKKSNFNLVFYFLDGVDASYLSLAEDAMSFCFDPLYEEIKLKSMVLEGSSQQLKQMGLAPGVNRNSFLVRLQHQIQFRKWVNENPDELTSLEIGERLKSFVKKHPQCRISTFDEARLKKERMNLLLAVGQGATHSPPRFHIVEANMQKKSKRPPLVLVGKGITFDSGGINLKPHESFVNCMKNDMGGAGLFANLFMGLIAAGYKEPLVLAIPTCENAIDAKSMKPGVIVSSRKGLKVIVEHTDAEGRLILADALDYVCEHYPNSEVWTAATLTTAALRQFGNFFTPVHFASSKLQKTIQQSSERHAELFTFWQEFLPFLNANRTPAADLTNMGRMPSHASMGSGSNVAAHFLKQFVGADTAYVHFDIFNTIWNWSNEYPGAHYGATGSVFNSLWSAILEKE